MSDVAACDLSTEGCSGSPRLGIPLPADAPRAEALQDFAQFERQQGDRPEQQPADIVDQ